jgi:LmbE family N-acetylglucosaminyl deacetylase
VVVAHPDDETTGCSAALGPGAAVVHVTDGAPRDPRFHTAAGFPSREAYAAARRAEKRAALAIAGVPEDLCVELGFPDQEAALDMPLVAARILAIVVAERPAFVLTHAYEGGHPDHDACAFATAAAVAAVARAGGDPPALMEFALYNRLGGARRTFTFVPSAREIVHTRTLDPAERLRKRRMYACYASQRGVVASLPIRVERVRAAPPYDFTRPPHAGPRYYEMFSWGMTSARWAGLATAAHEAIARGALDARGLSR